LSAVTSILAPSVWPASVIDWPSSAGAGVELPGAVLARELDLAAVAGLRGGRVAVDLDVRQRAAVLLLEVVAVLGERQRHRLLAVQPERLAAERLARLGAERVAEAAGVTGMQAIDRLLVDRLDLPLIGRPAAARAPAAPGSEDQRREGGERQRQTAGHAGGERSCVDGP
jgi:hypothetical protein